MTFADGRRKSVKSRGIRIWAGRCCWKSGEDLLIPYVPEICREVDTAASGFVVELPGRTGRPEPQMIFHVLTIFPDFFEGPFAHGVVAKAREAGHGGNPGP